MSNVIINSICPTVKVVSRDTGAIVRVPNEEVKAIIKVGLQGMPGVNGGGRNFQAMVEPDDLVGSIALVRHDLQTETIDVTTIDDQGDINIPWRPLGINHVQLDFAGLAPITKNYQLFVEAY